MSLILPPLLSMFASPTLLSYEGGAASVTMIMDWREFLGVSTVSIAAFKGRLGGLIGLDAAEAFRTAGRAALTQTEVNLDDISNGLVRVVEADPMRGWVVSLGWVLASLVDIIYLYYLIRRPTHILDFSLTLIFNHLILTTYYAGSFPTSFFFWLIITLSTVAQVVLAEQCCVARDMAQGFTMPDPNATPNLYFNTPAVGSSATLDPAPTDLGVRGKEDIELSSLRGSPAPGGRSTPVGGGRSTPVPMQHGRNPSGFSSSGGRDYQRVATTES